MSEIGAVEHKVSRLTDQDLYLFNEGTHVRLFDKLGAHLGEIDGKPGVFFAVWAPAAKKVHVMGDFNGWSKTKHVLKPRGSSGIWEGFVPGLEQGAIYKYWIANPSGHKAEKADPFGFRHEEPPRTASVVWDIGRAWKDGEWMKSRGVRAGWLRFSPMSLPIQRLALLVASAGSWFACCFNTWRNSASTALFKSGVHCFSQPPSLSVAVEASSGRTN